MTERERTYSWADPREVVRAMAGLDHPVWMAQMMSGTIPPAPFAATLGLAFDEIGDGRVIFSMELHEWMTNPAGAIHGGITATILDSVLTLAVTTRLPRDRFCTTIDLNVHYVRPLFPDGSRVRAQGVALHVGTTLATAEARLFDSRDRLIAHASTSLAILDRETTRSQASL